MPDIRELIGQVAARNNIRVDEDDPIFAVGTINRLMLEEAVEDLIKRIRAVNVQPTVKIPAGYKLNVRVNRDILFDEPYRPTQSPEGSIRDSIRTEQRSR